MSADQWTFLMVAVNAVFSALNAGTFVRSRSPLSLGTAVFCGLTAIISAVYSA